MKTIYKSLAIVAALAAGQMLTGCLEETFPTSGVTESQINNSPATGEALVWSMPAVLNEVQVATSGHYDWGYGSIMHVRDVMTADMAIATSGYDHYTSWEQSRYLAEEYATTGFVWTLLNKMVQPCNDAIRFYKAHLDNVQYQKYLGVAYAFRASAYLDLGRMYEFLPNDKVEPTNTYGNDVLGLTVPYVTENVTQQMAVNNPRLPHFKTEALDGANLSDSILRDLQEAERLITDFNRQDKTIPDLSVVYGLYARYYMWNNDYPKAAEYAGYAIAASECRPLTKDEWTNPTSGFNSLDAPAWMWGSNAVEENDVVRTGILNWTSWLSNETTFGYASAGPYNLIGSDEFYERISNSDFRKLSWVAPAGSPMQGKEIFCDQCFSPYAGGEYALPEYASLKFRPGQGAYASYSVAAACAYPLMRIEEMYLIQAEAVAHTSPLEGRELIIKFMRDHRDPMYRLTYTDAEEIVEEIVFQKRVELWGEGQTFFDIKRLNYSVDRGTSGSNFSGYSRLVTTGRPAWMNFVIVRSEGQNNQAVTQWNNPSFDGVYTPVL